MGWWQKTQSRGKESGQGKQRQGTEIAEKGLMRRMRQRGNVRNKKGAVKGNRKPTADTTADISVRAVS